MKVVNTQFRPDERMHLIFFKKNLNLLTFLVLFLFSILKKNNNENIYSFILSSFSFIFVFLKK